MYAGIAFDCGFVDGSVAPGLIRPCRLSNPILGWRAGIQAAVGGCLPSTLACNAQRLCTSKTWPMKTHGWGLGSRPCWIVSAVSNLGFSCRLGSDSPHTTPYRVASQGDRVAAVLTPEAAMRYIPLGAEPNKGGGVVSRSVDLACLSPSDDITPLRGGPTWNE